MRKMIILVIGSVTARQYGPVREELRNAKFDITISRAIKEHAFPGSEELCETMATDEERDEINALLSAAPHNDEDAERYEELMERLAARHVKSLGSVAAIVFDEESWDWLTLHEGYVTQAIASRRAPIKRWVVREHGRPEIVD